jgi:hypothetical protein
MTDATEIAAILTEFTEEQRRAALNQQRWRKLTVARVVGDTQLQFETVIDEAATAEEIYAALAPIDGAIERLKAKADLNDHYFRILNRCGEIELSVKRLTSERYAYEVANRKHNANKRAEVGLTAQQQQNLRQIRETIREGFERIDEMRKATVECERVLGGENPFVVLEGQINARLDALRGERQDAA